MQFSAGLFTIALAGFAALTSAQPHRHSHHGRAHVKPRDMYTAWVTKTVDQNGNPYAAPTPTPSASTHSPQENKAEPTPTSASEFSFASSAAAPTGSPTIPDDLSAGTNANKGVTGIDSDFPNGELDCSTFPSAYGAMPLSWVTKDGWSGIQNGNANDDHIGVCTEGALCSYACPPGYSKAQWPENQPLDGQSRGGLLCKNGKLYRTRDSYTKLCQAGQGTAKVENTLDKMVAFCRTDYPGSENMVVPLSADPGTTTTLTVPSADNSYVWRGNPSSAQYYVNNAGIDLQDGCVWGPPNGGRGNWSPLVVGAGYREGKTWLSISQNNLNSDAANFNIRIEAIGDAQCSQDCRYENGKFSTGDAVGCTVAVTGGVAKFVLY